MEKLGINCIGKGKNLNFHRNIKKPGLHHLRRDDENALIKQCETAEDEVKIKVPQDNDEQNKDVQI